MADEPALEAQFLRFGMKLERQRVATPGKSLVGADIRRCQIGRTVRQIERIAVPVKHGHVDQGASNFSPAAVKVRVFQPISFARPG